MNIIEKVIVKCAGVETEYLVGHDVTDVGSVQGAFDAIPATDGVLTWSFISEGRYSHVWESSTCTADIYINGRVISLGGNCCSSSNLPGEASPECDCILDVRIGKFPSSWDPATKTLRIEDAPVMTNPTPGEYVFTPGDPAKTATTFKVGDNIVNNGDGTATVTPADGSPSFIVSVGETTIVENNDDTTTITLPNGDSYTLLKDINLTVNAGTTDAITDASLGTATVNNNSTIHFWSSDGSVKWTVVQGSAKVDAIVDWSKSIAPVAGNKLSVDTATGKLFVLSPNSPMVILPDGTYKYTDEGGNVTIITPGDDVVVNADGSLTVTNADGTTQNFPAPIPDTDDQTASDVPITPIVASATQIPLAGPSTQDALGQVATEIKTLQDAPQIFAEPGGAQIKNIAGWLHTQPAVRQGSITVGSTVSPTWGDNPIFKAVGDAEITGNLYTPHSINDSVGSWFKDGLRFAHNYGVSNSYYGIIAGNFTSTGLYNIGIGNAALTSLTSGSNNVAVGTDAMHDNESGSNNTVIGRSAFFTNISGSFNTIAGVESGLRNKFGILNTYSGYTSGYQNVTGSYNTAFGAYSLGGLSEGSDNVGVGYASGSYVLSDVGITAVGAYAYNGGVSVPNTGFTALSSTQMTSNTPLPVSLVGKTIYVTAVGGYSSSISSFLPFFTYKVVSPTVVEVLNPTTQPLGTTGTVTGIGILSSPGFTNSTALGYAAQNTASNQVKLGNIFTVEVRSEGAYYGSAFNVISDSRAKKNISLLRNMIYEGQIVGYYSYNLSATGERKRGVIAQEIRAVETDFLGGDYCDSTIGSGIDYNATIDAFNAFLQADDKPYFNDFSEIEFAIRKHIVDIGNGEEAYLGNFEEALALHKQYEIEKDLFESDAKAQEITDALTADRDAKTDEVVALQNLIADLQEQIDNNGDDDDSNLLTHKAELESLLIEKDGAQNEAQQKLYGHEEKVILYINAKQSYSQIFDPNGKKTKDSLIVYADDIISLVSDINGRLYPAPMVVSSEV